MLTYIQFVIRLDGKVFKKNVVKTNVAKVRKHLSRKEKILLCSSFPQILKFNQRSKIN